MEGDDRRGCGGRCVGREHGARSIAYFAELVSSRGRSAPSPRLPSGQLRPSSTGYGEGRGEGALPHAQTRGEAPSPRAQERADLSPRAGRGERVATPFHWNPL